MGFTFSHPALILPIRYLPRKTYSLNGLIAGSMIPDLEYFMRLDNVSMFSHSFWGLFLFDVPAALFVLTLYHLLIRENLIKSLPLFLRSRMVHFIHFNWLDYLRRNKIVIIYSLIIGALTHLFWDGFTSGNGYFVMHNKVLETPMTIFHTELHIYKIIKHLSSLIAVIALISFLFRLPRRNDEKIKPNYFYWISFAGFACMIILLQLATYHQHISLNQLIKKVVSSALLAIFIVSLYSRMKSKTMDISG